MAHSNYTQNLNTIINNSNVPEPDEPMDIDEQHDQIPDNSEPMDTSENENAADTPNVGGFPPIIKISINNSPIYNTNISYQNYSPK